MKSSNLDDCKNAYEEDFKFYDENILMLSWYGQRIIRKIKNKKFKSLISLGIGHKIVSKTIIANLISLLDKYLIIEGSQEIINEFKNDIKSPSNVSIVNSLFEKFSTEEKFDAIEMGFVLEHVDDPLFLIKKYVNLLKPHGIIFIAVPNAHSLHRLIGHNAGMLDNLYGLSEYDMRQGHKRYFDRESLIKLITSSGLKIVNIEGIFLKPFSFYQLKSLNLSADVINSLLSIGVDYSEISNAIHIEAVL